jgi:hypothetical protein
MLTTDNYFVIYMKLLNMKKKKKKNFALCPTMWKSKMEP